MEVMMPSAAVDFNFDSACTTPYVSPPSTPRHITTFSFSAPTSPTHSSAFYNEFNNFSGGYTTSTAYESLSAVPFDWEERPGKAKESFSNNGDEGEDFAFDFSGQLEKISLSAEELFDGGKIKPLKPPPRLQYDGKLTAHSSSPKSPRSTKKMIKEALSPRQRVKDFDPFAAALEQTRKESISATSTTTTQERPSDQQRRREGAHNASNASSARQKGTRSLSPYRVSEQSVDGENNQKNRKSDSSSLFSTSYFASFRYRKWKLKDLLLFRSASEGQATSKDQLIDCAMLKTTQQEDVKNSSFRSTESVGSVSSSSRRGPVSAHELHYTSNRAVSEEMKKKTSLPYKQGLLGCLGFNPGAPVHEISKGIRSMIRTSS